MPLLNYTTTIAADKTASEIVGILARKHARNILMDYDGQANVTGIKWRVETEHGDLSFALPVNVDAVYHVLTKERVLPSGNARRYEQARRVAWRILKDWVEAQMALLETGMVRFEEVFLPYMLAGPAETLYQRLAAGGFKALPAAGEMEAKPNGEEA